MSHVVAVPVGPSKCKKICHHPHTLCIVGANTFWVLTQFFREKILFPQSGSPFLSIFRACLFFRAKKNLEKKRFAYAQLKWFSVDWKKVLWHICGEAKKREKKVSDFREFFIRANDLSLVIRSSDRYGYYSMHKQFAYRPMKWKCKSCSALGLRVGSGAVFSIGTFLPSPI
jgi:hypothetical protein